MRVTRRDFQQQAFVLDEEGLRSIAKILGRVGHVTFAATCRDKLTREFPSTETLLAYGNTPREAIDELQIMAESADRKLSASVSLANESLSNVHIYLDGTDDVIAPVNRGVEEQLAALKPWYHLATRVGTLGFAMLMLGGLLAVSLGFVIHGRRVSTAAADVDPRAKALSIVVTFGAVGVIVVVAWVLGRVRNTLFPIGSFALGAGRGRHRVIENVRWTVVVGFVVSAVAGIVVAALKH